MIEPLPRRISPGDTSSRRSCSRSPGCPPPCCQARAARRAVRPKGCEARADRPSRRAQQYLGDPRLEIQEHYVLDLLRRLSQPTAKDSEKDHTEIGVTLEDRQKIPAVQNQEFALRHRRRVRAPLLAVEHCNFAEDVAGVEDGKHDFFHANGKRADLDAAAQDCHHASPGRPFGEDLAAGGIALGWARRMRPTRYSPLWYMKTSSRGPWPNGRCRIRKRSVLVDD